MASVKYAMSVQVAGGPTITASSTKNIEAYDKIDVGIPPGGADGTSVDVAIQPGDATQVTLLLIKSSLYKNELFYQVSEDGENYLPPASEELPGVKLTEPQLFLGDALAWFGVAPKFLKFTNKLPKGDDDETNKAAIEIFVGRDV